MTTGLLGRVVTERTKDYSSVQHRTVEMVSRQDMYLASPPIHGTVLIRFVQKGITPGVSHLQRQIALVREGHGVLSTSQLVGM